MTRPCIKSSSEFAIEVLGENTLMLRGRPLISVQQHKLLLQLQSQIKTQLADNIIDIVASYHCLLIHYQFEQINISSLSTKLMLIVDRLEQQQHIEKSQFREQSTRNIRIPVYYDTDNKWDLANVANQCQMSVNDVITSHTSTKYHSYAHGFTPGFCYLAKLPQQICVARKSNPRTLVPQGAVAIAEQQTAVYPNEGPGGWNIIGLTPLPMYKQVNRTFEPTIKLGDTVSFYDISKKQYHGMLKSLPDIMTFIES